MPWITTHKMKYGFEYRIGRVPIAWAKWVKVGDEWYVGLSYPLEDQLVPSAAAFANETIKLREVIPRLHELTAKVEGATV